MKLLRILLAGSTVMAMVGSSEATTYFFRPRGQVIATPQDTLPDALSIAAKADADPSTPIESTAVTPTGFEGTVSVSVTGGEVSVAGGAWVASGSLTLGQSFTVRTTSSAEALATVSAEVTVGTAKPVKFEVTTKPAGAFRYTTVGGPSNETPRALAAGPGGTLYAAGDHIDTYAASLVLNFSSSGDVTRQRNLGAVNKSTYPYAISVGGDGSVAVAGSGTAAGRGQDALVYKLRPDGSVEWQTTIGGAASDSGNGVAVGSDGSVYMAGSAAVPGLTAVYQGLVVKLNSSGAVVWQRVFRNSYSSSFDGITLAADGSLVLVGGARRLNENDGYDAVIANVSTSGNLIWQKRLGSSVYEGFNAVASTPDGSIYAVGLVSGGTGNNEGLVAKYSASGAFQWAKRINHSGSDELTSISPMSDGSVVVAGTFPSSVNFGSGGNDAFVARLSASGAISWQGTVGGSGSETAKGVSLDAAGKVALFGGTNSAGNGGLDLVLYSLPADGSGAGVAGPVTYKPSNLDTQAPVSADEGNYASWTDPSFTVGTGGLGGGTPSLPTLKYP
jgi:uncharacterized delta-60 repeat protein